MDEHRFKIDAYTPETLPMARLAEYMADLAALLGCAESVHFERLEAGSTVLVHRVESEAVPKVIARVESVRRGDPDPDLEKVFRSLDKRLAEDNAVGELQVADAVLRFPGRERPKPINYGTIREASSIDGMVVSVGGRDATAHVILVDRDRAYTNIDISRELARELATHLYGRPVRLHGTGRWQRSEDGEWQLLGFRAREFEVLEDSDLSEVLDSLRNVQGGWPEKEDPLGYLSDIRNGPARRH